MSAPGKRARVAATALCGVVLFANVALAAEEYDPFRGRGPQAVATDRVIVRLTGPRVTTGAAAKPAPAAIASRVAELAERTRLELTAVRELGPDMQVVEVGELRRGADVAGVLARLRADPGVEFAEPDARMHPHRVPNDPGFPQQWFLQAPAPGSFGATASASDAVAAWDVTTGSASMVVAVLDTGVRFEHPDLGRVADGGKLLPGYDFVNAGSNGFARNANDGDGWDPDPSDPGDWVSAQDRLLPEFRDCSIDDSSWHGTRVSGMLAGLTDNATGIAGVGWDLRVLPVRVLGKCGGFTSDIIAGMRWAAGLPQQGAPANPTPARVLNLSLGGEGACSSAYQTAVDEIVAAGVLVIVSAGNDGSLTDQPANCEGAVSVTGVRHVGTKVGFANLGPDVTIAAPGGNCVNVGIGDACLYSLDTTTNLGLTVPGLDGYTGRVGNFNVGTSFASPIVSGVAALMLSVNGRLSPNRLAERLRTSARAFPLSSDPTVPVCRVPTGATDQQLSECSCTTATCGAGIVDAAAAVASALRPVAVVDGPSAADAGQTVNLSAAASVGADGRSIAGYAWSLQSGATSLSALAGSSTSFVAPAYAGEVVVRLTVTDDVGRIDARDAVVKVNGPPPPQPPVTPPPSSPGGGGSGGGGSPDTGLLLLAVLLGARGLRGRRRGSR